MTSTLRVTRFCQCQQRKVGLTKMFWKNWLIKWALHIVTTTYTVKKEPCRMLESTRTTTHLVLDHSTQLCQARFNLANKTQLFSFWGHILRVDMYGNTGDKNKISIKTRFQHFRGTATTNHYNTVHVLAENWNSQYWSKFPIPSVSVSEAEWQCCSVILVFIGSFVTYYVPPKSGGF